jgi:hypothetical protein
MYSWGASTDDWASPGAYSFDSARKAAMDKDAKKAAARGGRTYLNRSAPDLDLVDPRGRKIRSQSTNPLVVAVDVTGSMAHWPAEIFDRLPLLYQTLSQYRPDVEISFAAIGDATCDRFPLQVADFGAGADLDPRLGALYGEGGGGGGAKESYELFAHFVAERCEVPNASKADKPFLILYGDEGFYPEVAPAQIRHYLGVGAEVAPKSLAVWKKLLETWEVYLFRKTYGGSEESKILAQWGEALGEQRIIPVHDELRAVDLALGLVARAWGRYEDFEQNMAARQPDAAIAAVANSLAAKSSLASRKSKKSRPA